MGIELIQHPLTRADGSTILSSNLYTVIAGVNGPVEVSRRDELPEESAIEVNIRPSSGVGGPRERWLETILHAVLKSVILVKLHPRMLIQISLQITREPTIKLGRSAADISIIPALLNAAFAALVDGAIPLATTMSAILSTTTDAGDIILEPQETNMTSCKTIHAQAFDMHGQQLLDESVGTFDMETWERVVDAAQHACIEAMAAVGQDEAMENGDAQREPWLRLAFQERTRAANAWRGGP